MIDCTRVELDINTPIGIPRKTHIMVATNIIAIVAIVSSHMPKKPITKKVNIVRNTTISRRDANQANTPNIITISGQGEYTRSLSIHTSRLRSGSKKASKLSP